MLYGFGAIAATVFAVYAGWQMESLLAGVFTWFGGLILIARLLEPPRPARSTLPPLFLGMFIGGSLGKDDEEG